MSIEDARVKFEQMTDEVDAKFADSSGRPDVKKHQQDHDRIREAGLELTAPGAVETPEGAAAKVAAEAQSRDEAIAYATEGLPSHNDLAPALRPMGVTVDRIEGDYRFLCFGPNDEVVAIRNSSTTGRVIAVSTDNGRTWVDKADTGTMFAPSAAWTLSTGTILAIAGPTLLRTTDLFGTVDVVFDFGTSVSVMGQGLAEHTDGNLYAGAYSTAAGAYPDDEARVYRSTDDGQSWTTFAAFPTSLGGANPGAAKRVRHIHAVESLPSGLWVATGDNGSENALWRWSGGQFVRETPELADPDAQRYRAVSVRERDGRLYWITDPNPWRAAELGYAPIADLADYTRLAQTATGGFYSASLPDGSLLFSGLVERLASEDDDIMRLWAVDADDRVYETFRARAHPDAPSTPYPRIESLKVDSDGRVGFLLRASDLSGPTGVASRPSVLGRVRPGVSPFEARPVARTRDVTSTPVPAADLDGPGVIVPPISTLQVETMRSWLAANALYGVRFYLPYRSKVRYALFEIGTQAGNIQVTVSKLKGANRLSYDRIADTGIIPCPASGNARVDLGPTWLEPGDYMLALWADNNTLTVRRSASQEQTRTMRQSVQSLNLANGLSAASGTFAGWSPVYLAGFALEADV